jgi:hypothetical protein
LESTDISTTMGVLVGLARKGSKNGSRDRYP